MTSGTARRLHDRIPEYLRPYIAKQDATLYSPIDHATWRFILKVSTAFCAKHAHKKYLDGLKETGISTERIPQIDEMNEYLLKYDWQAVPVTGFIPPAVFTEFLSLGILPIACDMRSLEHMAYTPAPDIVHEAAGHAPIVVDPEYASFLKSFGEISRKAIFSYEDMDVYNAIRNLSDVKENPASTEPDIEASQKRLDLAMAAVSYDSEATLLSRMGWWTFEYGLVGSLSQPKIYGAGLLSSLGESFHCFDPSVKKVPFSIQCIETAYDITRPQPQLFVTPDFPTLKNALQELAQKMAFMKGGIEGLEKAKAARTTTTLVLESGIQASGVLTDFLKDSSGRPCYVLFKGPTQIAYQDHELEGQGADYHSQGFGSPLENVTDSDLNKAGFESQMRLGGNADKFGVLKFTSGVHVEGRLVQIVRRADQIVLLTFENCTVRMGTQVLFRPEWGQFDMICGSQVVSVFGGAADRKKYLEVTGGFHQEPGHQKSNLTDSNRELNGLYQVLRNLREADEWNQVTLEQLENLFKKLEKDYPRDWLLRYELLELSTKLNLNLSCESQLRNELTELSKESLEKQETIKRGLELLKG